MDISADSISDAVFSELNNFDSFGIFLFWLQVSGERDEVCDAITESLDKYSGVVPLVLRKPLFLDPNSWAMDVAVLIDEHRERFEKISQRIESAKPIAIVLVAKSALRVAQSSSPAKLPSWFPRYGGREATAFARDLRNIAGTSLKGAEGRINDLANHLYRFERAASCRVEKLLADDKHHGLRLWDSLLKGRSQVEGRREFVEGWKFVTSSVGDPFSYRPSLKEKCSLIGAVWASFVDTRPSALASVGDSLREFLGFGVDENIQGLEPLLPVIFRGVNDAALSPGVKLGRGIIVVIGSSCQLSTASAHADQYGRVRSSLLSAISVDLRDYLARVERALRIAD